MSNSSPPDDPELLAWFDSPPERRALEALCHVMLSLTDLPRWACEGSQLQRRPLTYPVYVACVESFFTSARLAAEFTWKMPKQDFTAQPFVTDWAVPSTSLPAWSVCGE